MPEKLVSRNGFSRPVPRQPAHIHTQAESGAYLRDSSRVPRRRPFMKPPCAIGSVPSLSGHAIAYRWRSLPRVRRHRASKPQGSSQRLLPWQVTMDQSICASLSHTHYWYQVGMLKVLYMLLIPSLENILPINSDEEFLSLQPMFPPIFGWMLSARMMKVYREIRSDFSFNTNHIFLKHQPYFL